MDLTINEQNFTVAALTATEDPGLYEIAIRCHQIVEKLAEHLPVADSSLFTEVSFWDADGSGPVAEKAQLILIAEHEDMRLYYADSQSKFIRHHKNPGTDEWALYMNGANAWDVLPFRKVVDGLMRIKKEVELAERERHEQLTILAGVINNYLDKVEDEAGLT
jgi:hypothetical protein